LKRLNTALLAPMPSPSDSAAAAVNKGVFRSVRAPHRRSATNPRIAVSMW
jgi:hypothetical protein